MPRIVVSGVSTRFGQREILRDISFDLQSQWEGRSSTFGLMGPSGSGKTTLLRYILDPAEKPTRGTVRIEPESLVVSFVPQVPVLFEDRSVLDNARYLRDAGINKARFDDDAFCRLAERLGMSKLLQSKTPVERLSGGEKQRLMLLRALSVKPSLLLLDEPSSGLDPGLRQEFLSTLLEVASSESLMIVYVSHHWNEVSLLCDTVVYLDGASRAEPTTRAFVTDLPTLIAMPPTLEAAKFVCEPKLNVVPARQIGNGTYEVGAGNQGFVIAFPILPVVVLDALGTTYESVSKRAIFSLIKFADLDETVTVTEQSGEASGHFGTGAPSGKAWVYDHARKLVGAGLLSAGAEKDKLCLRISSTS